MTIFDVDFDVDFMDLETAEAYDTALADYRAKVNEIAKPTDGRYAEIIRIGCEAVFDFLDAVLGEGASEAIFDGHYNLDKATDAMMAVTNEFNRQTQAVIGKIGPKSALPQNRQQRRFEKRGQKA